MTAALTRPATSALAPVLSVLDVMGQRHGAPALHGIAAGLVLGTEQAHAGGWLPADEVLRDRGVDNLLKAAAQRWQAQPHAAAALAWKCYSYWLTLPAVLGFASARRVPLMTPEHTFIRYADHQPFLAVALRDPIIAVLDTDPITATNVQNLLVVSDEHALLEVLRETLVERHLDPLLAGIRQRVNLGRRTLWGSVASGVAYGLSRAADGLPGSVLETTQLLLSTLDAEDLVEVSGRADGSLDIQRKTCCLAFTLPQPKVCTSCCIRST